MLTYEPFKITKAWLECWNNQKPTAYFDLLAPTAVARFVFEKEERPARQVIEEHLKIWHKAFPDLKYTVVDTIAAPGTLTIEWKACGTHTGMFRDIPPTGRYGELMGTTVLKLNEDGKIVREIDYVAIHAILANVGVLPMPLEEKKLREVVLQFVDVLNRHDVKTVPTFLVPDPVAILENNQHLTKAQLLEVVTNFIVAVPDTKVTANQVAIRGNEAVVELVIEGTHQAMLWGIAPTRKHIKLEMCLILTFRGEKIEKVRFYQDLYSLLIQVGAIPVMAIK